MRSIIPLVIAFSITSILIAGACNAISTPESLNQGSLKISQSELLSQNPQSPCLHSPMKSLSDSDFVKKKVLSSATLRVKKTQSITIPTLIKTASGTKTTLKGTLKVTLVTRTPVITASRTTFPVSRTIPPGITETIATLMPTLAESLDQIVNALTTLSNEWSLTSSSCSGNTCSLSYKNTGGDSTSVKVTLFKTTDEAHNAFLTAKSSSLYRIYPVELGDEAYGWQHLANAEVGVREKTILTIVDFTKSSGSATVSDAEKVASMVVAKV